jgi:hypothetical protein
LILIASTVTRPTCQRFLFLPYFPPSRPPRPTPPASTGGAPCRLPAPPSSSTRQAGPPFSPSLILRFSSATKRTRRPHEPKAAAASLSRRSPPDFTTPRHLFQSRSSDHPEHRRAPLLAPSLPELHRQVGPSSMSSSPCLASTPAGAVRRAGHNRCSPPSTDSMPGFFIPR